MDFASRWEVLLKWFSIIRCAAAGKGSGFFGQVVPPTRAPFREGGAQHSSVGEHVQGDNRQYDSGSCCCGGDEKCCRVREDHG